MKTRFLSLLLIVLLPALLWPQEKPKDEPPRKPADKKESPRMSEDEVRAQPVRFVNRSNAFADAKRQKKDIDSGRAVADAVVARNEGGAGGFEVKRVFNSEKAGFGADILSIAPGTPVDHINLVQRILQGYLAKAFEYSDKDAEVLSRFILYYNARQRGNVERVKQKYSEDVVQGLEPAKIGIDIKYVNWAGKTQLLVPLKKNIVRPGKTDINDGEVKKDSGKVTDEEKKKLDDVQKRRQEDDKKKLDDKDRKLKDETKKIEEEKKVVETKKTEIAKDKAETDKKLEELKKDPVKNAGEIKKTEEKKTEIAKKEEQVKKQSEEVAKKEDSIKKDAAEVSKQKEDNAKAAEDAKKDSTADGGKKDQKDDKIAELKKENEDLKKDQKKKEETSANVVGDKIFFLRVLRYIEGGGHYNNEMWMVDTVKDDTMFRGPFTNICGRELVVLPDGILVIGYTGAHGDSGHNLVLLDKDTLAVKKTSKEMVFWRTPMLFRDGKVYAFEEKDGNNYLSRLNPDLTFEVRSSEPISPNSDITFFKEKIYVTGKAATGDNTTIRVFNRADLKHLKTIEPPAQTAKTEPGKP